MATKVLSIEIGQGLTRVVEMDYKVKNPKVYNYFTFETPKDVIDDGMVKRSEAFASIMKAECEKRGIKTNQVVFSVSSSRIARRDAKIPFVKEKQIPEFLETSAKEFFPVDMTQYHLSYSIMEKISKGEEKGYRLNLVAAPNDLTSSYFDFAASLGCHLVALDYVGNSVYQVASSSFSTGVNVLLKIDETTSLVTVLKDGKIDLQRNVSYGINDAIEVLRKTKVYGENLTYAQAIEVLCGKTCIRRYLSPEENYVEKEDTDKDIREVRIKLTESLRYMIGMLSRVIEYYVTHNEDVTIDNVALLGLGADFSGLSKLLTNELNYKVRVLQNENVAATFKGSDDAASDLRISRYAACLGAAMNPINLIPEQVKGIAGKPAVGKAKADAIRTGTFVLVGGLLIAVLLGGFGVYRNLVTKADISDTEKHIAELEEKGVEAVYVEYTTISGLVGKMDEVYTASLSRNEDLVAFIEELEEKMPSSLTVMNFSATHDGVTMSIQTDSKESAAKTLMQLRTFDSIEVVSSQGLTDNLSDAEVRIVEFTVDCVYKPVDTEAEN